MVDSVLKFCPLIRYTGVEDKFHALFDEPGHMAVRQLRGITFRFARNGLNAQLINFSRRGRGEHYLVFQPCKERKPERIVFKHVEHSRDTHLSAHCLVRGEGLVGEKLLVFIVEQVRNIVLVLLLADTALAAVAADVLASAGETVDGQTAVVGTSLAVCHGGGVLERVDLLDRKHRRLLVRVIALARDQSRSERAHDAGDVRTDRLAVRNLLKAAQNRVVIESSALHNDVASQLRGVGYLNNLVKRVLDNGVRKAGGDIRDSRALLLRLLYFGIHKYRTARSEINRVLCEQSFLREILHLIVQGVGKRLDKGAAARGARLVELYAVHGVILDLDALHILSADVQDAVNLGIKKCRGIVVRYGLHFSLIEQKRRLDQGLSVTG